MSEFDLQGLKKDRETLFQLGKALQVLNETDPIRFSTENLAPILQEMQGLDEDIGKRQGLAYMKKFNLVEDVTKPALVDKVSYDPNDIEPWDLAQEPKSQQEITPIQKDSTKKSSLKYAPIGEVPIPRYGEIVEDKSEKDAFQAWEDFTNEPEKLMPFIGSAKKITEYWRVYQAAKRIENGTATAKDKYSVEQFAKKMQAESRQGEKTIGYNAVDIITALPAFMSEILMTGGFYSTGKKVIMDGAEKLATKYLKEESKAIIKKRAVELGLKSLASATGATLQTIPSGLSRIPAGTIERMLPAFEEKANAFDKIAKEKLDPIAENMSESANEIKNQVEFLKELEQDLDLYNEADVNHYNELVKNLNGLIKDYNKEEENYNLLKEAIKNEVDAKDKGDIGYIISDGADFDESLLKSLGDQWVEMVSERSGGLFGEMGKSIAKLSIFNAWRRANKKVTAEGFKEFVNKVGWNGIINESLEERVGEIGRAVLGIEDYQPPTTDQLLSELIAFSVPGAGFMAAEKLSNRNLKKQDNAEVVKEEAKTEPEQPATEPQAQTEAEPISKPSEPVKPLEAKPEGEKQTEKVPEAPPKVANKETLKQDLQDKFKYDEKQASATAEIVDAQMDYIAKRTGKTKEQVYAENIEDISASKEADVKGKKVMQEEVEIPEFTKDDPAEKALALGEKLIGNEKAIAELNRRWKIYHDKYKALRQKFEADNTDYDSLQKAAYEQKVAQLYREAREVADGTLPAGKLYQEAAKKTTQTPEFKKWFGDSKVVDEKGEPLVVYHGTTHSFDQFTKDRANVENDFGAGFYFTNNPEDVGENYSGEGPDLTQRIELRAEQIEQEQEIEMDEARKLAREELSGGKPNVIPVFLNFKNPIELNDDGGTWLEAGPDMEYYKEQAEDEVDKDDYEDDPDGYQEALDEKAREIYYEDYNPALEGNAKELISAFETVSNRYDVSNPLHSDFISLEEGISAKDLIDNLKSSTVLQEAYDEDGNLAGNEFIREVFEEAGFDGIIDKTVNEKFGSERRLGKSMAGMDENTVHYIAFKPESIKSAIGNRGTFDPNNPNILMQESANRQWYSKLQNLVASKMPNKADPQTILNIINKGGVKAEEIEYSGLNEFLEGKESVTKDELLSHLIENQVQVEEVVKGESEWQGDELIDNGETVANLIENENGTWSFISNFSEGEDYFESRERAKLAAEQATVGDIYGETTTKFAEYQEPGGENYRELLLTLPIQKQTMTDEEWKEFEDLQFKDRNKTEQIRYDELNQKSKDTKKEREWFKSGHFDEPNVLAHIRFNERTDADGKKVLFIEEIQSDWHQKGRKEGYQKELTEKEKFRLKDLNDRIEKTRPDAPQGWIDERDALLVKKNSVPDAPFKKTWHELAMKRAIRWAAENGFDKIAWTTGEMQAERYDLSKQLEVIKYHKRRDGRYNIVAIAKTKESFDKTLTENELEDYVGKDIAKKIANDEGSIIDKSTSYKELSGLDLKVGGEGMKGFYDKILPSFANKYGKKFGARVEEVTFETGAPEGPLTAEEYDMMAGDEATVHSLPITPAMRESVLTEGQPLFQSGAKGAIEFHKNGKATIHALEAVNVSTGVHEFAHLFLNMLQKYGLTNDLNTVLEWAGAKKVTVRVQEKFARGFERYLRDGKAPTEKMREVFESFKQWLKEIYTKIKGSEIDVQLSPAIRDLFDSMLGGSATRTVKERGGKPKISKDINTVGDWVSKRMKDIGKGILPKGLNEHGISRKENAGIFLKYARKDGLGLDDWVATAQEAGVISKSDDAENDFIAALLENRMIASEVTLAQEDELANEENRYYYEQELEAGTIDGNMTFDEYLAELKAFQSKMDVDLQKINPEEVEDETYFQQIVSNQNNDVSNLVREQLTLDFNNEKKLQSTERSSIRGGRELSRTSKASYRSLQPGEEIALERKYRKQKHFNFSSKTVKVQTPNDVAFIFNQLSDEAVENVFVLHVTDKRNIVQHLTSGTYNTSLINPAIIADSMNRFGTKEIYFVHNHPSGNIKSSPADREIYSRLGKIAMDAGVLLHDGIIIDSYKNIYGRFASNVSSEGLKLERGRGDIKLPVLNFSKQVFKADAELPQLKNADSVAGFISAARFTEGNKYQFLVLNNNLNVTGRFNLVTTDMSKTREIVNDMNVLSARTGGNFIILVSNKMEVHREDTENIQKIKNRLKDGSGVQLVDAVYSREKNTYKSLTESGLLKEQSSMFGTEETAPKEKLPSKDIQWYNEQVSKGLAPAFGKALNQEERIKLIEKQRKKSKQSGMDDLFGSAVDQGQQTLFQQAQSDLIAGEELNEAESRVIKNKDYDRRALKTLIHTKIVELKGLGKDKTEAKIKALNYIKQLVIEYAKRNLPKNFLKRHQAAILMRSVKNAKTHVTLDNAFKDIDAIALSINRAVIKSKIMKMVKIRPGKYKGKPRGSSLTADEYKKLNDLKNYVFMKPEDAYDSIVQLMERLDSGEVLEEYEAEHLYRLQLFGGMKDSKAVPELNKTLKQLQQALDEIESIVNEGRSKRQAAEEKRINKVQTLRKTVQDVVTGGKPLTDWMRIRKEKRDKIEGALSRFDTMQQSFEWLLDKLSKFDKSGPLESALVKHFTELAYKSRSAYNSGVRKYTNMLQNKLMEIYGIDAKDFGSAMKMAKILRKNSDRKPVKAKFLNESETWETLPEMTQNEIYKKYMEWQDPSLASTFEQMGWTQETMDELMQELDPHLKEWADWQLEVFYPEYYNSVNEIYRNHFYVDLPFNPVYSPIRREHGNTKNMKDDELLKDKHKSGYGSVLNNSFISRVSNKRALLPIDGDSALMKHIVEMEHFKAWADGIREMRGVLGSEQVQSAISEYHGNFIKKVLNKFIDDMARGGIDRTLELDFFDRLRAKFISSVIGINPTITLKQLMSIPAYSMDMPAGQWTKYTVDFMANPQKWVKRAKILMSSEYMKARYSVGWERDIILALQRSVPKKLSGSTTFRDLMMLNTKLGDGGAIIIGGWAMYKYHYDRLIANGMAPAKAKQKALEKFEGATRRTQQAGEPEDLPHLMRLGSWMRWFTLFMTSPNSYYRASSAGLRNALKGKGSLNKNLYRIAIAHFLLPMLFQFSASGFPGLFSDWDDKDKRRMLRAMIIGAYNGLFIAGDIIEGLANAIFIDKKFFGSLGNVPMFRPVDLIGQGVLKLLNADEIALKEVLEFFDFMAGAAGHLLGFPYQPGEKLYTGIKDVIADPEAEKLKLLGYSDYALGTEKPTKRFSELLENAIELDGKKAEEFFKVNAQRIKKLTTGKNEDKAKYLIKLEKKLRKSGKDFNEFLNYAMDYKIISADTENKFYDLKEEK